MVGIKVKEVQNRIKIGVGRTLNDYFITKNENIATNMELPKIVNVAGIMKQRLYKIIKKLEGTRLTRV